MHIESFREYCLAKPAVSEEFPFDETTLVFKVKGKMFALTDVEADFSITLKSDPERAISLREEHPAIRPAWHMNKTHWINILVDGSLEDAFIKNCIDHSYELVKAKLPLKLRNEL